MQEARKIITVPGFCRTAEKWTSYGHRKIEHKYKIDSSRVNCLFRKNRKGILAKIDDEMVTYYCNEDLFLLEVKTVGVDEDLYDITFIEIPSH